MIRRTESFSQDWVPGRSCPASYRYGAAALSRAAELCADTLWIAGGLYGNSEALAVLLEAFAAEPGATALVFNGDFHWFDTDAAEFRHVSDAVLAHRATRGNVETELAEPAAGAGCGCAYPGWVGDETVDHSNRIIERLRATSLGFPRTLDRLAALPAHLVAQVGSARIGIVHGDADSLAGWGFSQEALASAEGERGAHRAFAAARVDIFASSHTCLPVLKEFAGGVVVNNGAAGMPNFRGERYGLATRISVRPSGNAVYAARWKGVFVEAMALRYDLGAWERRFLAQWPPGSAAHQSYWERMTRGPAYGIDQALRAGGRASLLPGHRS
jgi:hypothetical protein